MKKNIPSLADMDKVNKLLLYQQELRDEIYQNDKWGWLNPLSEFAKGMGCIPSQSYGPKIEERLSYEFGLLPKNDDDSGDRLDNNGSCYEFKGSLFTSSNKTMNLVQLRSWQNVNYIFYIFDIQDFNNVKIQFFYLTKDQMDLEIVDSTPAHGTKKANMNNYNIERAIRIKEGSKRYKSWITKYGISIDDLKSLCSK